MEPRRFKHGARVSTARRLAAAASMAGMMSLVVASSSGASPFGPHGGGHHGLHNSVFLTQFSTVSQVASTVPSNGDVNPYGIAVVTRTIGTLVRGDTLVSNFNNSTNAQGTGTTIVQVSPSGGVTVFATLTDPLSSSCPGGVGLTTALTILSNDYVVVGSLPVDGTGTIGAGCLIVVNPVGRAVAVWSGGDINGPWDLTSVSRGHRDQLFVTNVLNGTVGAAPGVATGGTVVRISVKSLPHRTPVVLSSTVIASGFDEQLDAAALVVGPTGVALGAKGTLFVADTVNSRIAVIPGATTRGSAYGVAGGDTVSSGGALLGPLGLVTVPNGDVVAANGANGNAVEVTPGGSQVAVVQIDPLNAGGDLFGLAVALGDRGLLFVDDGDNTLQLLH